jgi:quinoprotein glucose dehydrogenase
MDRQGITEDDLIDFTPELHAEAKKIASQYDLAPIFTPPRVYGSGKPALTVPGAFGSGQWNSGAFDPETGIYYTESMTRPDADLIAKPKEKGATIGYSLDFDTTDPPPTYGEEAPSYGIGPQGLPLLKPPYGRITAYDMNKGEIKWMVPNGNGPRDNPALKGLNLPPLGTTGRPAPLVTGSLLFLGESSDAVMGHAGVSGTAPFRAYDKQTGAVVWQTQLPSGTTSNLMTYAVDGQQIIVIPIGNRTNGGEWIALGLGE